MTLISATVASIVSRTAVNRHHDKQLELLAAAKPVYFAAVLVVRTIASAVRRPLTSAP